MYKAVYISEKGQVGSSKDLPAAPQKYWKFEEKIVSIEFVRTLENSKRFTAIKWMLKLEKGNLRIYNLYFKTLLEY